MDSLPVALVGGLVGGTIAALIGGIFGLLLQRGQHRHEQTMAQEKRLQDRRARAYERALEHAYRLATWAERTKPLMGPGPEPPPPVPDEDMWRLNALTAAHASREVQTLLLAMSDAARKFQAAAWALEAEQRAPRAQDSGWREVMQTRDAFLLAVRALADRLGAELRGEA